MQTYIKFRKNVYVCRNLSKTKDSYTMNTLLFLGLGMQEILLIALIVLLLFGGKKIPELMRGLGKGVKSFKEGLNDMEASAKESKEEEKN